MAEGTNGSLIHRLYEQEFGVGATFEVTRGTTVIICATLAGIMIDDWRSTMNNESLMWSALTVEEYNEHQEALTTMLPGKARTPKWYRHNLSRAARDAMYQLGYQLLKRHTKIDRNEVILKTFVPEMDNLMAHHMQGKVT